MRRMYSEKQILKVVEDQSAENGLKVFENVVDKNGHPRFIEGEINFGNNIPEGVTKSYGKWALSGTHLLIVLGFDVENGVTIPNDCVLGEINAPKWIKDKIYPLWADYYINSQLFTMWSDTWTQQNVLVNLYKSTADELRLLCGGAVTLTATRHCRIAFDLLIDNE